MVLRARLTVLLAAGVLGAWASPAGATKIRYELTASYSQTHERFPFGEYCGMAVQPGPPGTPMRWVCTYDQMLGRTQVSYVARSTRPFVFTRGAFTPPFFSLRAQVRGRWHGVGGSSGWSTTYDGQTGAFGMCTSSGSGAGGGTLAGTISMSGYTRARVRTDIRTAGTPTGTTQASGQCSNLEPWVRTEPFGGFTERSWLRFFDLRKAYGETFVLTDTQVDEGLVKPPQERTTKRWTLRFTPVADDPPRRRRWLVEVRGSDRWSWGMYTGLRAGVDVEWAHRTTLLVEDGRIRSAQGKVHVLGIRSFSEPEGAFTVTRKRATTPAAYRIRSRSSRVGRDGRVVLGLLDQQASLYRVAFTVQPAGPQVRDQLERIGVPDPQAAYDALVRRGPITDRVTSITPVPSRVVARLRPDFQQPRETDAYAEQLPCADAGATQQDCFLRRGGQIVTVRPLN